ncbi:TPA: hypothetical protein ACL6DF_001551, partial [Streptococcus pneumoniae]
VFLDDIEDNIIVAPKLGIKTYQVKKRSDVVDILNNLFKLKTLYLLIRDSPLGFCVAFIKFTGKTC